MVRLALDDDRLPCARDRVTQSEGEGNDTTGLVCPQSGRYDVGVSADEECDVSRRLFGQEVGVDGGRIGEWEEFGVLATD